MLTINLSSRNVPIKRFTSMPRIHCISFMSFLKENISAKMLTKDYINPISIYNTHLCPAPARKQSFLIFSIYSTRFNEICFFFSTVPKGTWPRGERNWSAAKDKFKKMKGNTNPNFLQEYLKEFMWRRWHGELHPNGCFGRLMEDIAEQYPL